MQPAPPPWWRRLFHRTPAAVEAGQGPPAAGERRFGHRLEALIGRGSLGEVWRATDGRGQTVAIKLLRFDEVAAPQRDEARRRFVQEALAMRRLSHPSIIAIRGAGAGSGMAWMAMDFVPGHDLSRYTPRHRLLPEPRALRVLQQLAEGLAHAHARGIVHRDLKPANVRIDLPHDVVRIGDFGIARIDDGSRTRTELLLGSPAYMAPEQLSGAAVGPAADLWSLGVIGFELLTGRRPHDGASLGELMRAVTQQPPLPLGRLRPDLPAELDALLAAMLAAEAGTRPPAAEVALRCAALQAGWPAAAP